MKPIFFNSRNNSSWLEISCADTTILMASKRLSLFLINPYPLLLRCKDMYFKPHRMHNIQIFSYFYSKQIIFRLLPKERRVERPGFSCIFMQHAHTIPRPPYRMPRPYFQYFYQACPTYFPANRHIFQTFCVSLQLKNKKFNKHIEYNKHYGKEKKIFPGRRGHPPLLV